VAVAATSGPIGVLATNATAQSQAFTQAVQTLAPGRAVTEQGCPRFVPLVEAGHAESPDALNAACEYLFPLREAGAEAIILGCTHFPFLLPVLHRAASRWPDFRPVFVDPAADVVRQAAAALGERGELAPPDTLPTLKFAATGNPNAFTRHAAALLGHPLPPAAFLSLTTP